jgi:phosphoenolpyruvate synthase/pyruvate phosphate dikinase
MLTVVCETRRTDAATCGSKAANLGELASRGYAVPPFLVLPIVVYENFLAHSGLTGVASARANEMAKADLTRLLEIEQEMLTTFTSTPLAAGIRAQLDDWTRDRPVTAFAVRSSATNEDLPGSTFAGQYDSSLNVDRASVPRAVARCFASLFNARAAAYRRRRQMPSLGAMAVIVQEMVQSEQAGVAFSAVARRAGQLLIECAPGLGDAVVSGNVSPNRYYLNRQTLHVEQADERTPMAIARIREVARQALAIEAAFEGPQEVEFGMTGDVTYILQARPAAAAQAA